MAHGSISGGGWMKSDWVEPFENYVDELDVRMGEITDARMTPNY